MADSASGQKIRGQQKAILIGPMLLGVALIIIAVLFWHYAIRYRFTNDYILAAVLTVAGISLSAWGAWSVAERVLPNRRLMPAEIVFRPFPAYLGEKVRGRLSQTVRETSKINSVTIDLVCTKSTIHSNNEGGTSVETEELQRWSKQLDVSAMVEPPEKLSSVFSFDIPPNAPESTRGHKQVAIGWEVQLHTDIADCPDYHASFPLIIDRRIIVPGE